MALSCGKFLWQDRHGSILCTDECRNLYCQFMSFLYALALQDACHECACGMNRRHPLCPATSTFGVSINETSPG